MADVFCTPSGAAAAAPVEWSVDNPFSGAAFRGITIHQYHPSILRRDAIGNSILVLQSVLRAAGVRAKSWCRTAVEVSEDDAGTLEDFLVPGCVRPNDILLVHFSFYDDFLEKVLSLPCRKVIVYHNVTPGHFFRECGQDGLANCCDLARNQLAQSLRHFDAFVGDSSFNAQEMTVMGAQNARTIPVFVDFERLKSSLADIDAHGVLAGEKADEVTKSDGTGFDDGSADCTMLFVGRFVPNKRHLDLISCLAELRNRRNFNARLVMIGKVWEENYIHVLRQAIKRADLEDAVTMIHDGSDRTVGTWMRRSDIFLCMSEHEGFMVPVLEAFHAGLPVVSYKAGAVPETMGSAGVLFDTKDMEQVANLIRHLMHRPDLRRRIIAEQLRRATDFLPGLTAARWADLLNDILMKRR